MNKNLKSIIFLTVIVLVCSFISSLLHIRACLIFALFHIPCVGCGLTRAIKSIIFGFNLKQSLSYNILGIPILLTYIIVIAVSIYDQIKKTSLIEGFLNKFKVPIIILAIIATIITWIINLHNPLLY